MSNPERALVNVGPLKQALALATEAGDITQLKDIAAMGAALQKGARARGMGIESENEAAEVVLRAERAIGQALVALAEAGAFGRHSNHISRREWRPSKGLDVVHTVTREELGLNENQSANYQRLAAIPDDTFEDKVAGLRAASERFAKVDFYRLTKGGEKARKAAIIDIREAMHSDDYTPEFRAFEKALKAFDPQTAPYDELAEAASLVMAWVGAYNARRGRQAA